MLRDIHGENRYGLTGEDPLIQAGEDAIRADFDQRRHARCDQLFDELDIPHRGDQLIDKIPPRFGPRRYGLQRHAADEGALRVRERDARKRLGEGPLRFGQQRRVIRPRHGQHAGGEACRLQQPLNPLHGVGGPADDALIGGVVTGQIRPAGRRTEDLLDQLQRSGRRQQHPFGRLARFDAAGPFPRREDRVAQRQDADRDERREFAVAVARDDIGPQALRFQDAVRQDARYEHRQLRQEDIASQPLGLVPRHLRERRATGLTKGRVDLGENRLGGRDFVDQRPQHAGVLRALTRKEERRFTRESAVLDEDRFVVEQEGIGRPLQMIGGELQLPLEPFGRVGEDRQPDPFACGERRAARGEQRRGVSRLLSAEPAQVGPSRRGETNRLVFAPDIGRRDADARLRGRDGSARQPRAPFQHQGIDRAVGGAVRHHRGGFSLGQRPPEGLGRRGNPE